MEHVSLFSPCFRNSHETEEASQPAHQTPCSVELKISFRFFASGSSAQIAQAYRVSIIPRSVTYLIKNPPSKPVRDTFKLSIFSGVISWINNWAVEGIKSIIAGEFGTLDKYIRNQTTREFCERLQNWKIYNISVLPRRHTQNVTTQNTLNVTGN